MSFSQFEFDYTINAIFLTGGVATGLPGDIMPMLNLTQGKSFPEGVTGDGSNIAADSVFAKWTVMTGSTLVQNQLGMYPFANQATAANAIITQPLRVSMQMTIPATAQNTYAASLSIMKNLTSKINDHCNRGGLFVIATPKQFYADCILEQVMDITGNETEQVQAMYRWDFVQPLVTLEAARAAQNSLMRKVDDGQKLEGNPPAWSSIGTASGSSSANAAGAGAQIIPGARTSAGSTLGGR